MPLRRHDPERPPMNGLTVALYVLAFLLVAALYLDETR